jgi:hypothetical protein
MYWLHSWSTLQQHEHHKIICDGVYMHVRSRWTGMSLPHMYDDRVFILALDNPQVQGITVAHLNVEV